MIDIIDIHTHNARASRALISVDPRQFAPEPGKWYSLGYHPWHGAEWLTQDDFALLEQHALHPQVLAIGETGMDRLRGAALDVQASTFVRHLQLAARLGKPVIVHNVRATQDILSCRHRAGLDDVVLIIHGMRGNAHVARSLLDGGCYLSYGPHFNPAALLATPLDRLLIETDDASASIGEVASLVATTLHLTPSQVLAATGNNAATVLSPIKQ